MFRCLIAILCLSVNFLVAEEIEILDLDVISYDDLINEDSKALATLDKALHEKGIVGVRGVPGYREKYEELIKTSRAFNALPEEVKEQCKPNRVRGDLFLCYELGKERFKRPDGKWVIDDLKTSYYATIPDDEKNYWPTEIDLRSPYPSAMAF